MNKRYSFRAAPLALAAAAGLALTPARQAVADTFTWATPADGNFSTGFTPSAPPSDFGTQLLFGAGNYTATNDIGPLNLGSITVNNTDGNTVNIAGFNSLTFGGSANNLTVNGGSTNVVGQIFTTDGTRIVNNGGGTLSLNSITFGSNGSSTTIVNAGAGTTILNDSYNNGPVFFGTNSVVNLANTGPGQLLVGNLGPSAAFAGSGLGGTVNVTAGAVAFNGSTSGDLFGNGLVLNVAAGASFNFANNGETFGGLTGAGSVILGTAGLSFVQAGNRTFTGGISGTGGVTQNVNAVLTLGGSGSNTYTGTTTVAAGGTLRTSAANALSPNSVVSVTNGTLDVGGFSQAIAGLSGGNTLGALPLGGSTLTIAPAAGTSYTFNSALTGQGGLVVNGPGTENLPQNNTYAGPTTVSAGTLRLNVGGLVSAGGSATVAAGATLDAIVPADASAGTYFNGAGAFIKEGVGNLTFASANAGFTPSGVTVTGGTLTLDQRADNGAKLGTGTPLTLAGGSLAVTGNGSASSTQSFANTTLGQGLTGGGAQVTVTATNGQPASVNLGTVTRNVGATVDFNPANAGAAISAGLTNVTGGTVGGWATYGGGATWAVANADGTVGPLPAASYTANTFGASTHTDVTSSLTAATTVTALDVRFNAAAASTLTLAGTNTLTNGGLLVTPAVGANTTTITGGTLTAAANTDLVVNQFNPAGGLTISSALGNKVGTSSTATGSTTNASTGVTVSSTAGLFVGEGVSGQNIPSGSHVTAINATTNVVTISNAATNTASGITVTFAANTNLVKAGPGTLTLTRTNSYGGSTYINGGTLALSGTASTTYLGVAQDPIYFNGGTLSFTAGNIGSVAPANHPITVGPAGATFDFGSNQTIQGSGLFGTGPIVKTGAGILNVGSNASTFSGTVTVNGGGLTETSSQLTRVTGLTMAAGTQFQINDDATATFGIAAGAPVVVTGSGPTTGTVLGAFALTDQSGTSTTAGGPVTTFANPFTFIGDTSIGVYNGSSSVRQSTLIFPNPISGTGNLTKLGDGILVLASPNNSFGNGAGTVVVANGTLRLGIDNAVPTAATLQLGQTGATTSGTFDLNGFNQTVAGFSTAGSGTAEQVVNSSATATPTLTANAAAGTSQTFAGQLGGGTVGSPTVAGFTFVKAGTGTLSLTGVNTFTGTANASAGTLRVVGGANNAARPYVVATGANLTAANTDPNTPLSATTLTAATGSTLGFELDNGLPGSAGVLAVTTANGVTLNGTVNVAVTTATGSITTGTFPLLSYAGALGGGGFAAFNQSVALPSRAVGSLVNDTANHSVDLTVTGVDFLKYTGAVNANFDVNTTANFALNSSGGATTYLDQPSPDSVTFDDTAVGSHTVNLTTTLHPAALTVNTATGYTFGGTGSIAGTTGLTKAGTGTLTLLTSNTYTGTTAVNGGTVQVGNGGTAGTLGAGPVTVAAGATLAVDRSDAVTVAGNITAAGTVATIGGGTTTLTGTNTIATLGVPAGTLAIAGVTTLTGSATGPGNLTLPGGTLITAGPAVTVANAVSGTGGVNVSTGAATIAGPVTYTGTTLVGTNTLSLTSDANSSLLGTISGTGTINKAGAGQLNILGSNNGFTGTVNVNAGTVLLDDQGGGGDLGATSIVVGNGATFIFGPTGNADFPETTIVTVNAGGTYKLQQGENYGGIVLNGGTYVGGNGSSGFTTNADAPQGYNFSSGTVTSSGTGVSSLSTANATGTVLDKYTDGTVTFTGSTTLGAAVTVNVHQGTLAFGGANVPATGTAPITLGDTGTVGTISVTDGVAAATVRPIVLAGGGGVINMNSPTGSLTVNTAVTGSAGLTLTGAGTLTFNASNTYAGDTTVNGGTLALTTAGAVAGNVTVNTGGAIRFAAANASAGRLVRTLGTLTVNAGGSATIAPAATPADRTVLVTAGLTAAGRVDVSSNDVIVHNGSLSALTSAAAAGFANGTWNASAGLVSATAAADAGHLTGVGVIPNTTDGTNPLYSTFDGQSVSATDVLVKYTYYGDTNLDGVVNAADYTRIDAGFVNHLTGWLNGDFNYDGVVDGSDYSLVDNAFNQQAGGIGVPALAVAAPAAEVAGGVAASVPEPTSAAALFVVGGLLLGRRRRAGR